MLSGVWKAAKEKVLGAELLDELKLKVVKALTKGSAEEKKAMVDQVMQAEIYHQNVEACTTLDKGYLNKICDLKWKEYQQHLLRLGQRFAQPAPRLTPQGDTQGQTPGKPKWRGRKEPKTVATVWEPDADKQPDAPEGEA